jgi:hypothetical protein
LHEQAYHLPIAQGGAGKGRARGARHRYPIYLPLEVRRRASIGKLLEGKRNCLAGTDWRSRLRRNAKRGNRRRRNRDRHGSRHGARAAPAGRGRYFYLHLVAVGQRSAGKRGAGGY